MEHLSFRYPEEIQELEISLFALIIFGCIVLPHVAPAEHSTILSADEF